MRLDSLQLRNFRRFADLTIAFHPQLTVIVAENGQGKSTLLDAVRIGLWPFLKSFDLASSGFNDPANGIRLDDVRWSYLSLSQEGTLARAIKTLSKNLPVKITLTGDYGVGEQTSWTRYRDSEGSKTKTKSDKATNAMEAWAAQLQANIRTQEHASLPLPMLGYYGTGRLWAEKKQTREKKKQTRLTQDSSFYVRTFGYRDAMDPASSFKNFKEWFTWLSRAYHQHQNEQAELLGPERQGFIESLPEIEDPLKVVRQAIDDVLLEATGWQDLRYSELHEQSLMLTHAEFGRMKIDQLSEGIQAMIGMVADIAYRCTKLNPQLGERAAKETKGVVLIDEVDMHLHPGWQQLVLGQLTRAFPNIQFIVTTHSPQVLSTVSKKHIRVIMQTEDGYQAEMPDMSPLGRSAGEALSKIMLTHQHPPLEALLSKVRAFEQMVKVGREQTAEAASLRQALSDEGYEISESDLALWRFLAQHGGVVSQ